MGQSVADHDGDHQFRLSPRHYVCCKTLCMALGVGSQLAQAWQLVTPIDEIGQTWILFMVTGFPPPLIFENIRDMAGDKAIGRRTFALLLGETPVRIWSAFIMSIMPVLVQIGLFQSAATSEWRIRVCDMVMTTVCWTAAIRSLTMRTVRADRLTYQLFIVSYIVVLFSGCVLWA